MDYKGRILVVDDEADTVSLLEMTLELAGYRVEVASSGEDALRMLGEDTYDLVLLDIMMPHLSGLDVLHRLYENPKPSPPVVILTARTRTEDRERSQGLGAAGYLVKPVTRGDLLDTIQKLLGEIPDTDALG
jgi:DNA-binding response OmpR family regulator